MRIQLRGHDGVMQRMREIQARMDSLQERAQAISPLESAPLPDGSGLQGAIGVGGSGAPVDPFGAGMRVGSDGVNPEIESLISKVAVESGVDTKLLRAIVEQESAFNPYAVSNKGAQGLMQLMPTTSASLGIRNPFDPLENLRGGARYFAKQVEQFGDLRLALAAYNAGPGAVERYGRQVPPYRETQDYVRRILFRAGMGGSP